MDIVAHSTTLISIIIGLGLTEMFGNLHRLIRNRSRVTWDWLPVAWAAALLIFVVNYWWSIFLGATGSVQANNAAELGSIMVSPILLFLTTASVLPNFDPDSEWDMRRHYEAQRSVFILTLALYQVSTWATAILIGTFGWNFISVVRGINLTLLFAMLMVNKRRWDWVGVLVIMALLIFRLTTQVVR